MIGNVVNFKASEIPNPITTPKLEDRNYYLTPETANDIFNNSENKRKKRTKALGIAIGTFSVLVAVTSLLITKGLPKNLTKWFQNASKKLENIVTKRKQSGESGLLTSFFKRLSERMAKFSEKSKSINNFTSFKDLSVKKVMEKNKFTKKLHEKTTRLFEKMARQTVKNSYQKTNKQFKALHELTENMNSSIAQGTQIKIGEVTKSAGEWIKDLTELEKGVQQQYQKGFGKSALQKRYSQMKRFNTNLQEQVWDIGINGMGKEHAFKENIDLFKASKLSKTFIAEEVLAKDKALLSEQVGNLRGLTQESIQKMLDLYKGILSPKSYAKLERKTAKALKSLNKSINTENNKFFDKLRDLTLGSAPTDVITILCSILGVGIGLTMADNKEERVSATLRAGVPVIGGVATALLMNISLISGFSALAGGLISTKALNTLGVKLDDTRKLKAKANEDKKFAENIKQNT